MGNGQEGRQERKSIPKMELVVGGVVREFLDVELFVGFGLFVDGFLPLRNAILVDFLMHFDDIFKLIDSVFLGQSSFLLLPC